MNVFSALMTPTIAVVALTIAYRQWRTAQSRLKLDLFDRRLIVHDSARNLITSIYTSGKTSQKQEFEYLSGTRGAIWLYDAEIVEYLDKQIWSKVSELSMYQAELEGLPVGDERTEIIRKQREVKDWLFAQIKILEKKFTPYLKLDH